MTLVMAPNPPNSSSSPDDAAELTALARLAGSGDPVATRHFLDRMWPTLARVVNSVLGSRHPEVDQEINVGLRYRPAEDHCHLAVPHDHACTIDLVSGQRSV